MTRSVVEERLGLRWEVHADPYGLGVDALAGLAVRDNPKRAHLVVSTVLAKHVPVRPSVALERAAQLAELVQVADPVVLGFCETATGLGHAVAESLRADYVHTTRRPDPRRTTLAGFEEEHSHATRHALQPPDGLLDGSRPLVLVDDELTTGTTALNTIEALPRCPSYVLATLLDLRTRDARAAFEERAAQMGVDVRVVALLDGELLLPGDVLERGRLLQGELKARPDPVPGPARARVRCTDLVWDGPTGGRHGFLTTDYERFEEQLPDLDVAGPVLVLGTEELMHLPVKVAVRLEEHGLDVRVQSTTRSPVLPLDDEGYAIRRRLVFPTAEGERYLYNLAPAATVVVVTDDDATGLVEALLPWADDVHVVRLR